MKKLILLIFITLVSCVNEETEVDKTTDYNTTIDGMAVRVITYEGCEYIKAYYKLAHKGNCKNKIHCYNETN